MNDIELPFVQTYSDRIFILSQDLEPTAHCLAIAVQVLRALWPIRRTDTHFDVKSFMTVLPYPYAQNLSTANMRLAPVLKEAVGCRKSLKEQHLS